MTTRSYDYMFNNGREVTSVTPLRSSVVKYSMRLDLLWLQKQLQLFDLQVIYAQN